MKKIKTPFPGKVACMIALLAVLLSGVAAAEGIVGAGEETPPRENRALEELLPVYQPYLINIGPYKPVYFLLGANPEKSRFQLSFKYQLFGDESALADRYPWVTGIHLGYTQTSSWDLKSDSAPFEDTSYMPEVFFTTDNLLPSGSWFDGLFIQSGVQHESNGQGGDASRSTNYVYFTPQTVFLSQSERVGFYISPKVLAYFNNSDKSNPDFSDYRGNFELELKAGFTEGLVAGSTFRFAPKGTSVQLDATYPLSMFFFSNLDFYIHAQYANSLAETMLHYKKRTEAFRIGFSIVR